MLHTSASRCLPVVRALTALPCVLAPLAAQCETHWGAMDGILGVDGQVFGSIAWDPDGPGPMGVCLVIGGDFRIAADVVGNGVAMFDPATGVWSTLGTGFSDGWANAFVVLANGDLLAVGRLDMGGYGPLARWNGTAWVGHSGGFYNELVTATERPGGRIVAGGIHGIWEFNLATNPWVTISTSVRAKAMATLPNGDAVVAGTSGATNHLLRWDGTSLQPFATGLDGEVLSMDVLPNGDLLVCGGFTTISGVAAGGLARWNGVAWQAVAPGLSNATCADVGPGGDIYVSGWFTSVNGMPVNHIARWDGTQWFALQWGLNSLARRLVVLPSGDVFPTCSAGGFTAAGNLAARSIAHWNGSAWLRVGGMAPNYPIADFARSPNGDVVVVGSFSHLGNLPCYGAARWRAGAWQPMHNGLTLGSPSTVRPLADGSVIVGGDGVQRWNGSAWTSIGFGTTGGVQSICQAANGDVVVGGPFTSAGGVAASNIARWDGSSWSAMGAGLPHPVTAIVAMPNGEVVASSRNVYRWNGAAWSLLGSAIGASPSVIGAHRLVPLPDGSLLAAGELAFSLGANIARWNGVSWSPFAPGLPQEITSLDLLPDGDVVVFGRDLAYPYHAVVRRWDGVAWTLVGQLLAGTYPGTARKVGVLSEYEVGVAGRFDTVDGQASQHLARLTTTCPAAAQGYGAGCSGSAGPVSLSVDSLPWVGGTFRATTTGVPQSALAVGVGGLSPGATPLPAILPQGVIGCELLASPEALFLLVPTAGQVRTEIPIPATALYLHKQFFHQVVVFELGATADITAVTSSNAVALQVGAF